MLRAAITVVLTAALLAGCASPQTKAEHRMALDACLRAPDPRTSVDCERADILREQMDYERSENASLAFGAFAVSILTLGIIAVVDDNDHYGGYHHYRY